MIKLRLIMKNQCFFASKTRIRRVSQSTDARLVLGLPGVRGRDLSPAQRAWQCPGNCVQTSFVYTSCLLFQGPLRCTRTHVVAHESPGMTNMWMKFFIPHPSVRMHVYLVYRHSPKPR